MTAAADAISDAWEAIYGYPLDPDAPGDPSPWSPAIDLIQTMRDETVTDSEADLLQRGVDAELGERWSR